MEFVISNRDDDQTFSILLIPYKKMHIFLSGHILALSLHWQAQLQQRYSCPNAMIPCFGNSD